MDKICEEAVSKAQRRLMAMALQVKEGDASLSDFPDDLADILQGLVDSMSAEQLRDFAETDEEGLPDEKSESLKKLRTVCEGIGPNKISVEEVPPEFIEVFAKLTKQPIGKIVASAYAGGIIELSTDIVEQIKVSTADLDVILRNSGLTHLIVENDPDKFKLRFMFNSNK